MSIIVGDGDYRYEQIDDWAKLPPGWSLHEVGAVGVDKQDNVYVFNRGEHPMMVFDREGNFLRSWGEGLFPRAHGLHMAPDDTVFLTDDGDHSVRQCTLDGKVLLTLGMPGKPAPFMSGEPFHRCTHTALVAERRHLCVGRLRQRARAQIRAGRPEADVVGRVRHRAGPVQSGAQHLLRSGWLGLCRRPRKPSHPGVRRQRPIRDAVEQPAPAVRHVHAVLLVPDLLCRRTGAGDAHQPQLSQSRAAAVDHRQQGQPAGAHRRTTSRHRPQDYIGPHGLTVDSHGDIYVGEVSRTLWPQYFGDQPVPDDVRVLRKLRKIS